MKKVRKLKKLPKLFQLNHLPKQNFDKRLTVTTILSEFFDTSISAYSVTVASQSLHQQTILHLWPLLPALFKKL